MYLIRVNPISTMNDEWWRLCQKQSPCSNALKSSIAYDKATLHGTKARQNRWLVVIFYLLGCLFRTWNWRWHAVCPCLRLDIQFRETPFVLPKGAPTHALVGLQCEWHDARWLFREHLVWSERLCRRDSALPRFELHLLTNTLNFLSLLSLHASEYVLIDTSKTPVLPFSWLSVRSPHKIFVFII